MPDVKTKERRDYKRSVLKERSTRKIRWASSVYDAFFRASKLPSSVFSKK